MLARLQQRKMILVTKFTTTYLLGEAGAVTAGELNKFEGTAKVSHMCIY